MDRPHGCPAVTMKSTLSSVSESLPPVQTGNGKNCSRIGGMPPWGCGQGVLGGLRLRGVPCRPGVRDRSARRRPPRPHRDADGLGQVPLLPDPHPSHGQAHSGCFPLIALMQDRCQRSGRRASRPTASTPRTTGAPTSRPGAVRRRAGRGFSIWRPSG